MNDSDNLLSESLKYLAAAAPEEAPRRIAANLELAFRRHHLRRKGIWVAQFTALAASLLLAAVLWMHWDNPSHGGGQDSMRAGEARQPAAHGPIASASPAVAMPAPSHIAPSRQHFASMHHHAVIGDNRHSASGKFIFMPGMDQETPTGSLMVVRLELPTSALSLVGLSAIGDSSQDRVLADILIDQDGTPYAIRVPNEAQ
jgi:hypothetical protein